MDPTKELLILQSPRSPSEWDAYFDLLWRILREPWGQPRGSERDSMDDSAFHLFLLGSARKLLECRCLRFNAPDEAQVRFMAVDENARGRGYGSRILQGLEAEAARRGAQKLVLNAPDNVNGILCQARLCGGWCGRNAFWRDSPSADREGVVIS